MNRRLRAAASSEIPDIPAMPVPTSRLLWLTGLVFVPGITLAFFGGGLDVPGAVLAVLAVGIAVVDLARSAGVADGIEAAFQEPLRIGKGREAEFTLDLRGLSGRCRRARLGIAFGREIETAGRVVEVDVPAGAGEPARARWVLRPVQRGRFVYDTVHLEVPSPAGLWSRRRALRPQAAGEIRVYPDLRHERRKLSATFLHRGGVGMHAERQVGKGRDFEQLREYSRGDDYADIFWKATARRGYPMTKTYQLERTQEVYVAIDHSRLSAREFRSADGEGAGAAVIVSQLERFIGAALGLGLVAEQQGDLFGVLSFAEHVDRFVRARNGRGHYDVCRDALYNLAADSVSPDFEEFVIFLRTRLTRRSLLVVLTDLSDAITAESFVESIELVSRQHLVLVVSLRPVGVRPLFDREPVREVAEVFGRIAGQMVWDDLSEVGRRLGRIGAHFIVPDADELAGDVVANYLSIKGRQLL